MSSYGNSKSQPQVGVGVLIFNKRREVLLGKRKNAHGASSWGPPGGHLELYETFEECAIREVKEETNIQISSANFLAVTNDFFKSDKKHYISIFMTAYMPLNQQVISLEPHKVELWEWFDLNNLPRELFLPIDNLISGKYYDCRKNEYSKFLTQNSRDESLIF